jgi:hypothetical protein
LKDTGIAKYIEIMVSVKRSTGIFAFFGLCLFFACGTSPSPAENQTPAVFPAEKTAGPSVPVIEAGQADVLPVSTAEAGQAAAPPAAEAASAPIAETEPTAAPSVPAVPPVPAAPATTPVVAGQAAIAPASAAVGYVRDAARFGAARREVEKFAKGDSRQDYASGAVFANFREIRSGGIPPRTLYRGSHPAFPGDARFPYAQQLAENARVVTVLNLADTEDEIVLRAENIPWYQNFINKNNIIALALPNDFTAPGFFAGLKNALSFMAARSPPYLIHDIDGGERTGFIAALLEALMGASAEEIAADYMASYINLNRVPADGDSYRIIAWFAEDVLLKICDGKAPERCDLRSEAERLILGEIGLDRDELDLLKRKLSGIR